MLSVGIVAFVVLVITGTVTGVFIDLILQLMMPIAITFPWAFSLVLIYLIFTQ